MSAHPTAHNTVSITRSLSLTHALSFPVPYLVCPAAGVCPASSPCRWLHPDIHYLEEPASDFVRAVAEVCLRIHTTLPHGDILAFLPGSEEIDNAVQAIQDDLSRSAPELIVRPLYAALPFDDQLKALEPGKILRDGKAVRKCVIATNIAETSVTIPGIVYVVDSGFVKVGLCACVEGRWTHYACRTWLSE
jgi:hypothetical protein